MTISSSTRNVSSSHRTVAEQLVGLGIYLLLSFGALAITQRSLPASWMLLPHLAYLLSLGASMWLLWRSYSLKISKLELSLFLSQMSLLAIWSLTMQWPQMLLGFVVLLLLWCNTLIATLLFWKKERLAGALLLFPLVWIFYLAGLNMMLC